MTQNEIAKLKAHITDVSVSIAKHKTALTTIPEDAKHIPVRAMQQNLIDKLGEELQRSQTKLKRLEDTIAEAKRRAPEIALAKAWTDESDRLKKNPPRCPVPKCGFASELVAGVRQPTVMGLLGNPNARAWLDFVCTNPSMISGRHRFKVVLGESKKTETPEPKLELVRTKDGPRVVKATGDNPQ